MRNRWAPPGELGGSFGSHSLVGADFGDARAAPRVDHESSRRRVDNPDLLVPARTRMDRGKDRPSWNGSDRGRLPQASGVRFALRVQLERGLESLGRLRAARTLGEGLRFDAVAAPIVEPQFSRLRVRSRRPSRHSTSWRSDYFTLPLQRASSRPCGKGGPALRRRRSTRTFAWRRRSRSSSTERR